MGIPLPPNIPHTMRNNFPNHPCQEASKSTTFFSMNQYTPNKPNAIEHNSKATIPNPNAPLMQVINGQNCFQSYSLRKKANLSLDGIFNFQMLFQRKESTRVGQKMLLCIVIQCEIHILQIPYSSASFLHALSFLIPFCINLS